MQSLTNSLLKASLVAFSFIEVCSAAVSQADLDAYPEFAATMATAGNNYDWASYQVTTEDGYVLSLWRVTGSNETPVASSRGPILLSHGDASDGLSWFNRDDLESAAYPVKLFDMGFDVWIANARGTKASLGHTTLNYLTDAAYWDWSFNEMGQYDLTAMTQGILEARSGDTCAKVSVITHGSAVTQTAKASLVDPLTSDRVDRVVSVAPCFFLDMNTYDLPIGDAPSAQYFFSLLAEYDIQTLWGEIFKGEVEAKMCPTAPAQCAVLL